MRFSTYWRSVRARALRRAKAIGQVLQPMQGRRRVVFAATGVTVAGMMAFFVAAAFGVLEGSPSKFEAGDGNMIVDHSGNTDWNCFTNLEHIEGTEGCQVTGKFRTASESGGGEAIAEEFANAYTTKDISWKSGQKQDTECPVLEESKPPAKDAFTNVASYNETAFSGGKLGDTFLYGATIRVASNGNASENVELNQKPEGCTTKFGSIKRTAGDKLIAINYLKGGGAADVEIKVLTWVTSTSGFEGPGPKSEKELYSGTCSVSHNKPPCWSSTEIALNPPGEDEGNANEKEIPAKQNGINGKALEEGRFAEFGINLTKAGIIAKNSCTGFAQAVWESRTAGSSFTSNPEDIEIEKHPISNCGTIKVVKVTEPAKVNQEFKYTSNLPKEVKAGGTCEGIAENGNFCLNANSTANSKVQDSEILPGSYKVKEGAEPLGFAFVGVSCKNQSGETVASSTTDPEVLLELGIKETIECTYTNKQQLGAIEIEKTSTKGTALSGAEFEICTNKGPYSAANPCSAAQTGSDKLVTESDGTKCVEGLPFGTYFVTEKKAPSGYRIREESQEKEISANSTCTESPVVAAFADEPLTEISITAKSEAVGGTKSTITCTPTGPASEHEFVEGKDKAEGESATVSQKGLKVTTYTCTVVVDP